MRMINVTWVFLVLLSSVLVSGVSAEKTLVSDVENISARNATTRIFNRTYSVPVLDAQFQPTGETRLETRKLVEKADGLCYDAALDEAQELVGPARWEPTVARFVSDSQGGWSIGTGPAKVHIAPAASSSSLISFTIPFRISNPDKSNRSHPSLKRSLTLAMKGGALYYVCGEQNALLEVPRAVAGHADGNRIIFKGAFSCGDLEFVYEKGAFHQNVIVRNAGALPAPTALGLDPATVELRVVTDIENASLSAVDSGPLAENKLVFCDSSGHEICAFERSEAWLESAPQERIVMAKTIAVVPGVANKYSHSEGVPYTYILEKSASGPIVLDYQTRYGTAQSSEAWQAGVTYWVSDQYTAGSGYTLAIEGSAVVKVHPNARININTDGRLNVKGTPFNYVLFGKANDAIGETPTNPPTTGPTWFFYIIASLAQETDQVNIQFAKFANATYQAICWQPPNNSSGIYSTLLVQNTMFLGCRGIMFAGPSWAPGATNMTLECFNCLFTGDMNDTIYQSMWGYGQQLFHINLYNCTFARETYQGNSRAVYLSGNSSYNASTELTVKNCLFTNYNYGMECISSLNIALISSIMNNGIDLDECYLLGPVLSTKVTKSGTIDELGNPYIQSPNGNYYLGEPDNPNVPQGTKDNLSDDYKNRLSQTTVIRPANVSNELSFLDRSGWSDLWSDLQDENDEPDIGFHYDIVHGVVDAQDDYVDITSDLDLQPGAVIAMNNSKWLIIYGSGVTLKSNGLPNKRIRFIGINATCDRLTDPYRVSGIYGPCGIEVALYASMECDYTELSFLICGLYIDVPENTTVKNSIFKNNVNGLEILYYDGKNATVQNCLFIDNAKGIKFLSAEGMINYNVIGSTFSDNEKAIDLLYSPQGEGTCNMVFEDNILTGNTIAINRNTLNAFTTHDIIRNNIFWNNGQDTSDNTVDLTLDTTNMCLANGNEVNPLFAHRSRSADGSIINNWESDKEVPIDGYYLAQRTGDASRRPLFLAEEEEIVGLSLDGIPPELEIFVATAWPIPDDFPSLDSSNTFRIAWNGDQAVPGSQEMEGPVYVALANNWKEPLALIGTPCLEITLQSGGVLTIYLPEIEEIPDGAWVAFWVAEDGSTYWAHTSKEPSWSFEVTDVLNMDGYYAARWSEDNLARSAYDGRLAAAGGAGHEAEADSPAVDDGSKDWLNGGTTVSQLAYGYYQQDNIAPPVRGGYDNYDSNNNNDPVAWEECVITAGTGDDLDIGYHYWGACYDSSNDFTTSNSLTASAITLRHPKERIPSFDGISPNVSSSDDMVLVSGKYDANTGKDTTIAIYKGTTTNNQIPICYKLFRGGTSEQGIITSIPNDNNSGFKFSATAGPADDDNGGSIYFALNKWYFIWLGELTGWNKRTYLGIYRYDTSYPSTKWRPIAELNHSFQLNPLDLNQPISLAAQDENLWVFWLMEESNHVVNMYGSYLEDAAIINTLETLNYDHDSPLITLDFSQLGNEYISLKSDWDDYLIDQYYPNGMPRIVYVDSFTMDYYTQPQIWAKRVHLLNGYPDYLDPQNTYYPIGYNNIKPTFCVNRPYDRFQISHNTNRAYCRFANPDETQIEKRNLNILQNGNDEWVMPTNHTISSASQPSVTYRAFGTERLFYLKNQQLYEEEMGIFKQAVGDVEYPQVITERPKAENIFLMHKGDSSDIVDIYHIVP